MKKLEGGSYTSKLSSNRGTLDEGVELFAAPGLCISAQFTLSAAELAHDNLSLRALDLSASDDPTQDPVLPRTQPFVRVWQKSTDGPIPLVRVNCHSSSTGDAEIIDSIKAGKKFELFPGNDSFTCTFVWMGTDRMLASQHFVIYSPPKKQDVLMMPFYCRLCLWTFDHTGFDLYNNATKSYVNAHNWLLSAIF